MELVLNSIDWLLDDTRLIAIRSRTTVAPPLRPSDRGGTLKLATAGVPSLVLLFLGGLVLVRRER